MTSIITPIAIPLLYLYVWYPGLNQDVTTFQIDTVKLSCDCADHWGRSVENYIWQGTNYRTLTLFSSEDLLCTVPTTIMLVQAFFWYDSSKAINDSSRLLSPSFWLAVYDPTLTFAEALENDYTRLTLVNANGEVTVNMVLNYRQVRGKRPAYDYNLVVSTVPAMDRHCDIGSETDPAYMQCFISLWLQFPTFERQVSTQSYAISWADVVASAGSWMSLSKSSVGYSQDSLCRGERVRED
ncbi:hypothetical protein GGR53DRAFT_525937 [Hypoxylon sp. FL1150]|nr:hypothetical protein GGR53DRAFT_525937 [Hypoxylon sp. FL1150]